MSRQCNYCAVNIHLFCARPNPNDLDSCCCTGTKSNSILGTNPDDISGPGLGLSGSSQLRPHTTIVEPITPVAEPIIAAPVVDDNTVDKEPEKVELKKEGQQSMHGKWTRRGAPLKQGSMMKSLLATGRARAKQVKPILPGDKCEWAKLRYAGGGIIPIIGCNGSEAVSVHHGPNKSVLFNEVTNLHRVCQVCHERWHICNDVYYGDVRPPDGESWLPSLSEGLKLQEHNPSTLVTDEAYEYAEHMWKRIRNASRHSRAFEADSFRDELTDFYIEGLITVGVK